MKQPLINTGSYLLVVSDDEIKEEFCLRYVDGTPFIMKFDKGIEHKQYKIIAHLPLNESPILQGVDLLPPLEQEDDVEELANEEAKKLHNKSKHDDYDIYNQLVSEDKEMIKIGYNKAKEKYKYTEDDMRAAYEFGLMNEHKSAETNDDNFRYYQSLSGPKLPVAFKCEIHDTIFGDINTGELLKWKPKTTTDSGGQTVLVGRYIYE